MARILTEHLESGVFTRQRLINLTNASIVDAASGDGSRRYLSSNGNPSFARLSMLGSYSEVYGETWFESNQLPGLDQDQIIRFFNGSTQLASFQLTAANVWAPKIGASVETAGSLAATWGVWHCAEFHYKIHASTGALTLKIDGIEVCSFTGDTVVSGLTVFDIVEMYYSTGSAHINADGLVINDTTGGESNSWPGIIYVSSQDPDAVSATYNAWSGSAGGDKNLLVDEYPPNETDFVYSVTNAQKQGFSFGAHSVPVNGVIQAVIHEYYARKISSGQVKMGMRDGGVDAQTAALDLGVDWAVLQNRQPLDPSAAAWNLTTADSVETFVETVI